MSSNSCKLGLFYSRYVYVRFLVPGENNFSLSLSYSGVSKTSQNLLIPAMKTLQPKRIPYPSVNAYEARKIQAKETTRWQGDTKRQAGRLGWVPRGTDLATSSGDNMLIR